MGLSSEQIAFRNAALVRNLREKYTTLHNYSDEALVKAYDEWFMCVALDNPDEDGFQEFLEEGT